MALVALNVTGLPDTTLLGLTVKAALIPCGFTITKTMIDPTHPPLLLAFKKYAPASVSFALGITGFCCVELNVLPGRFHE